MSNQQNFQVKCYLSQDELDSIKNNAKECDMILSGYVREAASNFCIFMYDFDVIFNHNKEVRYLYNAVRLLINVMKQAKYFYLGDCEYIIKKINEISHNEGEFLKLMLNDIDKKRSVIKREVKRSVRRHLVKEEKNNEKRYQDG